MTVGYLMIGTGFAVRGYMDNQVTLLDAALDIVAWPVTLAMMWLDR